MHARTHTHRLAAACLALAAPALAASVSNVCPTHKHAWGENIGWTNWKDANAGDRGVRVFPDHMKGFIWAENVGWINVGDGGGGPYPSGEHGVNILASGYTDGFAWGENIGWINLGTEPAIGADGARWDPAARRFRGYAWAENVGWINLDDAQFFVAALIGDANGDGAAAFGDLNIVLAQFGFVGPDWAGDLNGDEVVDFSDLNLLLAVFGDNCP